MYRNTYAKINLDNNFETITRDIKRTNGANEELESILGMKINRIDSFDNSNLFGSFIKFICFSKKHARYIIIIDLANSLGCMDIGPKLYQL